MTASNAETPATIPHEAPGTTESARTCTRCHYAYPIAAFRLVRGRWLSSWCDGCYVQRNREWRAANRDHLNAARRVAPVTVRCPGCEGTFIPARRDGKYCCRDCGQRTRTYGAGTPESRAAHRASCARVRP
jgi:hypothetical protein